MEKEIGRDPEGMGKKEERKERGRDGGRGENLQRSKVDKNCSLLN